MKECLTRISELQDQIDSDLKKVHISEEDEKEGTRLFYFYENCQKLSENSSKKMKKIDDDLRKLVSKIKSSVFPDESNWREWNSKDFSRYDKTVNVCVDKNFLFCSDGCAV